MPDSAKVSVMGIRPLRLAALLGAIGLAMALAPVSAAGQTPAPGQYVGEFDDDGSKNDVSFTLTAPVFGFDAGRNFQIRRRGCGDGSCVFESVRFFTVRPPEPGLCGRRCREAKVPMVIGALPTRTRFTTLTGNNVIYNIDLVWQAPDRVSFVAQAFPLRRQEELGLSSDFTVRTFQTTMVLQGQAGTGAAAARNAGPPARAAASALAAATATRTEYVTQLDSICQSYDQPAGELIARFARDTRGLLKDQAHGDVADTEGRLLRALGRFLQGGAGLLGQMSAQISAIPPPLGDEATVAGWLQGRASYERIVRLAGRAARRENAKRLFVLLGKAGKALAEGDQQVASFGFQQCV